MYYCIFFGDSLFDYTLTPDDSGLLLGYIQDLQQENQQLKEQLEKKYEKVGTLTNEILYEENTKLLSVLDEIREYITKELDEPDPEDYREYTVDISWFNDLLQILDKVKEWN